MSRNAPGKHYREGISLLQMFKMFPDEMSAERWFEELRWGRDGENPRCPRCGSSERTRSRASRKPMPWYCGSCSKYFSVRTGTCMEESRLPLQKWVFAIYLEVTSLKGISSMKLHRELDITQKSAWFMLHRIREVWKTGREESMKGIVEADETYMGGRERNKHSKKKLRAGRGPVGKSVVVGVKDRDTNEVRAEVVDRPDARTLQGFVERHTDEGARVFTDEARAYVGMKRDHESVKHSVGEYVRGIVHTQGMESFWATLKRAHKGVYHKMSRKHMHRYVRQFAGKHNIRNLDTMDQMAFVAAGMVGKRLMYRNLIDG